MSDVQDKDVQILLRAFGMAPAAEQPMGWAAMPAPQAMTDSQITADKAIANLAEQYRNLQMQAGRILTLFGSNAPCEVINRHWEAVQAYMAAASDVFNQLTRQGFTVVQSLYNLQGEKTGEQKGPEPVRPAYFEPCKSPTTGTVNGASFRDSTAFGNVVLNLGVMGDNGLGVLPVIAWIVIALIAGGTVVAVTHTIVVNNPALPIKQVEAQGLWMDNYLSCVERTMKQGLDHAKADAACRGLTAPPAPPKPIDMNQLLFYGLLGIGVVGAAMIVAHLIRSRRERAFAPHYAPELPEHEPAAADLYSLPPLAELPPPPELPALPALAYAPRVEYVPAYVRTYVPRYVYALPSPPPAPMSAAELPELAEDATLDDADDPAYVRGCPCR